METFESLGLRPKPIRAHTLAATTMVFGDDCDSGRREAVLLSGFVQLNKWPMPGFEHRVDEQGCASFDAELISAPAVGVKGYSYELDDRIQVVSNPFLPNTGRVRQITPGKNFPADLHLRRFGILETSTLRLAHRDAIDMHGVVDSIPPVTRPLSGPYLGHPRGDGPSGVQLAPGVLSATNLPAAWYPANDKNEPVGDTPTVFFAAGASPFTTMTVDPSVVMQSTLEGMLELEVAGKTVKVEVAGDQIKGAGAEILLFGPDKHNQGPGTDVRLARLAVVGHCAELGGRIMLRVSWPRPSGGSFGEGTEVSLSRVRYPSELHLDANFEVCTPHGTFCADNSMHLAGCLKDLDPRGTELRAEGPTASLMTADNKVKARITDVQLVMRESHVGEMAAVNI